MNHKHDVNQVLLKFGLLLTSLVSMAPLLKTMCIFEQFSLLSVTFVFPFTPVTVVFFFFFCFVCLFVCFSSKTN